MRTLGWIALALLVTAAPGLAQETADAEEMLHGEAEVVAGTVPPFDAIDHDADGLLSWEEVRNMVTRIFHDSDTDGDGVLSDEEFVFGEEHWSFADYNGDGRVEDRELLAHAAIIFGRADGDGDEKLDRNEAALAREQEGLN